MCNWSPIDGDHPCLDDLRAVWERMVVAEHWCREIVTRAKAEGRSVASIPELDEATTEFAIATNDALRGVYVYWHDHGTFPLVLYCICAGELWVFTITPKPRGQIEIRRDWAATLAQSEL